MDFDADIVFLVTYHFVRHTVSQVEVGTVPVPPCVDVFDITDGERLAVLTTIIAMACKGYRGPATFCVVGIAHRVVNVSDEGDAFARHRHIGLYTSACIEVTRLDARHLAGQIVRRAVGSIDQIINLVLRDRGMNLIGSGGDAG